MTEIKNITIISLLGYGIVNILYGPMGIFFPVPLQPFLICYIFKGDSFYAQQRINNFFESNQNESLIWQSLQYFFQKSKSVELHSIPKLDLLITEIFVDEKN
ncbi:MAG: hypothetical protein ACFFE5_12235 [Candidatus Thorarchaeota archaeon]